MNAPISHSKPLTCRPSPHTLTRNADAGGPKACYIIWATPTQNKHKMIGGTPGGAASEAGNALKNEYSGCGHTHVHTHRHTHVHRHRHRHTDTHSIPKSHVEVTDIDAVPSPPSTSENFKLSFSNGPAGRQQHHQQVGCPPLIQPTVQSNPIQRHKHTHTHTHTRRHCSENLQGSTTLFGFDIVWF